jgi:hypothetical protein
LWVNIQQREIPRNDCSIIDIPTQLGYCAEKDVIVLKFNYIIFNEMLLHPGDARPKIEVWEFPGVTIETTSRKITKITASYSTLQEILCNINYAITSMKCQEKWKTVRNAWTNLYRELRDRPELLERALSANKKAA